MQLPPRQHGISSALHHKGGETQQRQRLLYLHQGSLPHLPRQHPRGLRVPLPGCPVVAFRGCLLDFPGSPYVQYGQDKCLLRSNYASNHAQARALGSLVQSGYSLRDMQVARRGSHCLRHGPLNRPEVAGRLEAHPRNQAVQVSGRDE